MFHYIYLIREREFREKNVNVFKLGKTTQAAASRIKGYPKDSEGLIIIQVQDSGVSETKLLRKFRDMFKPREDIGREYFEHTNPGDMIKLILEEFHCPVFNDFMKNETPPGRTAILPKQMTKVLLDKIKLDLAKSFDSEKKKELKTINITQLKELTVPDNFKAIVKSKEKPFIIDYYDVHFTSEELCEYKSVYLEYDELLHSENISKFITFLTKVMIADLTVCDRMFILSETPRDLISQLHVIHLLLTFKEYKSDETETESVTNKPSEKILIDCVPGINTVFKNVHKHVLPEIPGRLSEFSAITGKSIKKIYTNIIYYKGNYIRVPAGEMSDKFDNSLFNPGEHVHSLVIQTDDEEIFMGPCYCVLEKGKLPGAKRSIYNMVVSPDGTIKTEYEKKCVEGIDTDKFFNNNITHSIYDLLVRISGDHAMIISYRIKYVHKLVRKDTNLLTGVTFESYELPYVKF